MKNKIFIAIFIIMGLCVFSQAAVDIFDPLYEDIRIWENIGLLNDVSSLRPYPLQEIERILNIVIESGAEKQIKKAQEYKKRLFGCVFHYGGEAELGIKIPKKQRDILIAPLLEMNISINRLLTASAHADFSLLNKLPKEEGQPAFQFSKKDIMKDSTSVGSFYLLPMFNSGIAVGTPEYYFTAGMARTSFGPFDENNILIGEQAFHSGQFIFVVNKEKFTYNQALLAISASDDRGGSYFPQKFTAAHSITYRPLPWISVGLVDIITYGGRFEPIYLLPLSVFFVGQSIYNFADASMLGLTFTVKPIKGLKIDVVLLADDIGFNEIVKFKKDAKWRMAGQFGVSYAMPKDHWFSFADINYTLVTPYCYTSVHNYDRTKPNYENYTHNGEPLGSNLPPNSDRIRFKAQFTPLEGLAINISNTFIRHANVMESVYDPIILGEYLKEGDYSTDGSVFNHSAVIYKNATKHSFLYSTPFLTQQTIQYINQLGLEGVVNLPILKSAGLIQFKMGYTFETNINPGVNNHIYTKSNKITDSSSNDDVLAEANKQLKTWREKAVGKEFNHYFNIGVKISY
ncbi:hypothetical protein [Treponema putidum]|uniref:hypothetical protein n=1 Tax=Treponema putidum TaxID=221027 RepID=UPI003D907257